MEMIVLLTMACSILLSMATALVPDALQQRNNTQLGSQ